MFCPGISLSTNSAVIGLTSLLFNKAVNGFNSIIDFKNASFAFILFYSIILHSLKDIII